MSAYRRIHLTLGIVLTFAPPAWAYVGPGTGLVAIGTALATVAAVILTLVGFVWYPLKRLVRGTRRGKAHKSPVDGATA